jgi:hypothetical protein
MNVLLRPMISWLVWLPGLAWAQEEATYASYRGIASLYYTLIWVILAYGLWDAFGKKALYVGGPVLAIIIYFLLPSA